MTNTTNTIAPLSADEMDNLEQLAKAANPHSAMHLVTHYRNAADVKAEEAWRQAANPATILALIAQARLAAQPVGAVIKTWQERMWPGYVDGGADLPEEVAMKAEIADLRAALAAPVAAQADTRQMQLDAVACAFTMHSG
jgi:hypothetical protein